ncbi:helix-turn-helix domain-containing protein [Hellea balneolensis]|uniref:helix-turn-helix domain-containing protein n=1 Tax=Hellea balneolensis TaxID=287478 RepID=UPI00047ED08F
MIGSDLTEWRERNGYSQKKLQIELGIKSRGTISSWENSDKPLSRTVELALIALERMPELRKSVGEPETQRGRAQYQSRFGEKLNSPLNRE